MAGPDRTDLVASGLPDALAMGMTALIAAIASMALRATPSEMNLLPETAAANPTPPPGTPIWPSIAARDDAIQYVCSPWSVLVYGPTRRDDRPCPRHLRCQRSNSLPVDRGDLTGPLCGLRHIVGLSQQTRLKALPADAIRVEELHVVIASDQKAV